MFAEKIEIDEEKDLEYFHVPAHNDVTEASDYLYDFKNVSQTTERYCLFKAQLTPEIFFRLRKSITLLPDYLGEKYSLHSATILTHATTCSHIYSSQKQNTVILEMTSEAKSSRFPLFRGREHGMGQFHKL